MKTEAFPISSSRILVYDIIRVIAILFVVCIHSMEAIDKYAYQNPDSIESVIANLLNSAIHTGVPLFVMLSGALLLDKDESIRTFFCKRVKRVLLPFIVWSVIVYFLDFIMSNEENIVLFLKNLFIRIITNGVHGIYWYIYMLLGLYLFTPFLRVFFKYCGEKNSLYFVLLLLVTYLISDVFPSVQLFSRFSSENLLYLFYYTSGYIIYKFLLPKMRVWIPVSLTVVIFFLNIVCNIYNFPTHYQTIVLSLSLFGAIYNLRHMKYLKGIGFTCVNFISKVSYGIYLSHFLFISLFYRLGIEHFIPLWLLPFIMVTSVMVIECGLMYCISKIRLKRFFM